MKDARLSLALAAAVLVLAGCSEQAAGEAPAASAPVKTSDAVPTAPANTGTVEVRVAYAGAPVVETMSINKDVEQCGTQARIEKIAVGDRNGLAWAVASVAYSEANAPINKAQPKFKKVMTEPFTQPEMIRAGGRQTSR